MKRKIYAVFATRDGGQLPSFLLDADTLGIVSPDHAARIARTLLGDTPGLSLWATLLGEFTPVLA